jgi:diketogulonate reductase-like aldo/keto reductase
MNVAEPAAKGIPIVEVKGARIPILGLGTMRMKEETCVNVVSAALRMGYRHLDAAERYENEQWVGEGLRASGVKREEVFVTTKVYGPNLAAKDFGRAVDESLRRLQLSFVDLLLIHWPNPAVPLAETLGALAKAKQQGLTRHIGVANFTTALLDEAAKLATEPLVTNQVEVHPFLDQSKVIAKTRQHGLAVTAYCPIARGRVPGNETLERIAKVYGKTAAQVALRWLVQQGIIVIPGTSKEDRLKENVDVFDFVLSDAEMAEITALKKPDSRVVNPPHAPQWDAA